MTDVETKQRVRVRSLTESDYPAWTQLVDASPHGSVYNLPTYLDVLCGAAGGKFAILGIERHDELVGGVALYEMPHRLGSVISNRLLLQYNGIVLARHDTKYPSERTSREIQLMTALATHLDEHPALRMLFHNRSPLSDWRAFRAQGWSVTPSYTYIVPIADLDKQWEQVERNLRRLINRCGKEGYQYDEADDFAAFFALHSATHDRKGAPIYLPKPAFERYFTRLRAAGLARLCHVRLPNSEQIIASQLVLHSAHPVTHTASASADPQHISSGANPFLRWQAFKSLAAAGYAANDLTDASLNPVTHFKSQFGGDLTTNWTVRRPDARRLALYERKDDLLRWLGR